MRQEARSPEELERQRHGAREFRHWVDELGMVRFRGALEPEIGIPFVNRLDAETEVFREAHREGREEERHAYAADAFARMLSGKGKGKGPAVRPEVVAVADWLSLKEGKLSPGGVCKIPGVGPISPATVRRMLVEDNAFLTAVLYEGKEFKKIKRWSRTIPKEIQIALEIGEPPHFDGRKCKGCGSRFRPQGDHRDPHANGGLMSIDNLDDLCPACHAEKTEDDRRRGLLGRSPP